MSASPKRSVASVACALLAAGCATVTSSGVPVNAGPTPRAAGLTYFLPMRLMKFTATRMTPLKLKKAAEEAAAKAAEADAEKTKAADLVAKAKAKLDKASGADVDKLNTQIAELEGKATEAAAAAEGATATANDLKAALEEAQASGSPCIYTAGLELMPARADPRFRYVARMNHSGLRDDHMELKLNEDGLLSSSNVAATDHTGDILVEAIAAATVFGRGGLGPVGVVEEVDAAPAEEGETPPHCATLPPQFQQVFDPTRSGEMRRLNMALADAEFPFSVQMTDFSTATATAEAWAAYPNSRVTRQATADPAAGIYYRTATPVMFAVNRALTIDATKNPNPCADARAAVRSPAEDSTSGTAFDQCVAAGRAWQPVDTVLAALPQAGPVSFIPMTATAFVKSTDDVVFVNGSVTSWTRDRPSEVLAFVKLPAALVSRISELLTIRVTYTTNRMGLAQKQREEILADLRWRLLEDCVADAQAKGTPIEACLPK